MQTIQDKLLSFPLVATTIFSPREAFDRLAGRPVILLALLLMALRYSVASFATVANLYYHDAPMLAAPVAIDPALYRYYEIYWYGPYGILMMLAIAGAMLRLSRQMSRGQIQISFNDVLGITALAFFTPWLVTLPFDFVLIASGHGAPQYLIPLHLSILAWEAWLVAIGMQSRFGLSKLQAARLGLAAAGLFIALGGLLIR